MRYLQHEHPYLQEQYSQREEKPKLEKNGQITKRIKFLEGNVQRWSTKLQKLQHDLTLTPSTNTADLWPKQLINQHDYHKMTHSRTQDTHKHDTYTDSYIERQQQIRLNVVLSWQIQAEEQKYLAEHIKQIENKRSFEYQYNKKTDQTTPDPPLSNRYTENQRPEYYNSEERLKNQNSQESFRDKQI